MTIPASVSTTPTPANKINDRGAFQARLRSVTPNPTSVRQPAMGRFRSIAFIGGAPVFCFGQAVDVVHRVMAAAGDARHLIAFQRIHDGLVYFVAFKRTGPQVAVQTLAIIVGSK